MKRQITVEDLLKDRESDLALENFTPTAGLQRPITHPNPTSPGLALAGFMERVRDGRAQVFGETEMAYLEHLDPEMAEERLTEFFHHQVPVVFVTKDLPIPEYFLKTAAEYEIPVFRTALGTGVFFQRVKPYLEAGLAPVRGVVQLPAVAHQFGREARARQIGVQHRAPVFVRVGDVRVGAGGGHSASCSR